MIVDTGRSVTPRAAYEQAQLALAEFLREIGDREMTPDEIRTSKRLACEQAQLALAALLDEIGDREMTPDEWDVFVDLDAATVETEAAYYASLTVAERYELERVIECEVEVACREAGIPYDPHDPIEPFPLPEDDEREK